MVVPFRTRDAVVWLQGAPVERALVGDKGADLNRLAALGAPVPEGFALSTLAYRSAALALELPMRTDGMAESELADIRAEIMASRLPADLANDIARAHLQLGVGEPDELAVTVRTSAPFEHAVSLSIVDQPETIPGVRGLEALETAVKQCWASHWTERAVAYRKRGGFGGDDPAIAVIVQRTIRSDVSFLALTADPDSGRSHRIVIDATWGSGEALASGRVTPDRAVLDATGELLAYEIGEKAAMIIPTIDGTGTREVSVPRALRAMRALQPGQVSAIAKQARALSAEFGGPFALEGGVAGGRIFFFRAHPMTTIGMDRLVAAA